MPSSRSGAAVGPGSSPGSRPHAPAPFTETPSQTVGPYFAIGLPWERGPAAAGRDGVRIWGYVLDGAGEPIPDALVETWYHDPPAFARCPTGDDGGWEVTVPRSPYLAVHVFARGLLRHLSTRVYLDPARDDPVLALIERERADTLIARRSDRGFRFDIRVQGDRETVFFDL